MADYLAARVDYVDVQTMAHAVESFVRQKINEGLGIEDIISEIISGQPPGYHDFLIKEAKWCYAWLKRG